LGAAAPNINKVSGQLIDYSLHGNLSKPIYVFRNYALKYYLGETYGEINTLDFDIENNSQEVEKILSSGGTVLVIDFPKINEDSLFWQGLQGCKLLKSFEDKNVVLGYVFSCGQQK
jgi:hypothetical protein